ncbi:MAG TPA: ATP-binding protein [Candidatus Saccharimonadales bacterium]|nr:ATP-binding protein [Candidatus Saccharimonadales bacterium]
MATRWTDRLNMFGSARLKLTFFYLGIIVLFNLLVTLSVRVFAEHEFLRSNTVQRSEVREWVIRFFDAPPKEPDRGIADIQEGQAQIVRQHLNDGLLIINLGAFIVGGILSYWFAGRTLKPIEEAHGAQARFTADASHELRTPLANMRLENEVFLRQRHFTEKEAREQLESNLEEVQRLERLSGNLLALHQYGQVALTRSQLAVRELVDAATMPFRATAAAKAVNIHLDIAPGRVWAHHDSIVQLIDILLDNALKYGARGGEVLFEGRKKGTRYMLSVKDKGPGIAAQDLPRIFDRLYRGDKARSNQVPGLGLGLALANEIAGANGATMVARNNKDGGACFELSLEIAV